MINKKSAKQSGAVVVETAISIVVFMFIVISVIEILRFSFMTVSIQHVLNQTLEHATKANFTVDPTNCAQQDGGIIGEAIDPATRLNCIKQQATEIGSGFGIVFTDDENSTEGYQLVVSYQDKDTPVTAADLSVDRCQNSSLGVNQAGPGDAGDLIAICIRAKNLNFFANVAVDDLDFIVFGRNETFRTPLNL